MSTAVALEDVVNAVDGAIDVYVDGELATCEPASSVPLARRYMLR